MMNKGRRVITGLNAEGKSCVLIDGPLLDLGGSAELAWRTEGVPADNTLQTDCPTGTFDFDMMHSGGTMFMVMEYPAESQAYWHATDTLEYIAMLEGEIVLELEAGEVTLRAGDVLADRGVVHSWRNDSGQPARAAITMVPALPVGKGRTV
jgi:quercetin dioxygenase-like cupin family protein